MHQDQANLRALFNAILDRDGDCYATVLAPWLSEHADEGDWLASVAARPQLAWRPGVEALWRLYAASRVNELLLLRFQPVLGHTEDLPRPNISLDAYLAFMTAMGTRTVEHASFHPFFHEIAGVEPTSDARAPIEITSTLWPCLMLGELMFSRAGVVVRAGSDRIDRDIATRSTLYWAYHRAHRPTSDLSVGWGGNSQWRTSFRRDIAAGSMLHFNADGKWDLRAANVDGREDLTIDERIELLTHRSFVRTAKPHDDCWPYDDRLTIAAEV